MYPLLTLLHGEVGLVPCFDHVGFTNHGCLITIAPCESGQCVGIAFRVVGYVVSQMPMTVWILAGDEADSRWSADRIVAERLGETYSTLGQRIKVWCSDISSSVTHAVCVMLIAH